MHHLSLSASHNGIEAMPSTHSSSSSSHTLCLKIHFRLIMKTFPWARKLLHSPPWHASVGGSNENLSAFSLAVVACLQAAWIWMALFLHLHIWVAGGCEENISGERETACSSRKHLSERKCVKNFQACEKRVSTMTGENVMTMWNLF